MVGTDVFGKATDDQDGQLNFLEKMNTRPKTCEASEGSLGGGFLSLNQKFRAENT